MILSADAMDGSGTDLLERNNLMTIRAIQPEDRAEILEMMQTFYTSPAVFTDGSSEIFERDFAACIGDDPFLEGFVFAYGEEIAGYAMIAKSFSTEFGKRCIWLEDLYLKEQYRGMGIGSQFLEYLTAIYADHLIRLEVEDDNEAAVHTYRKYGFMEFPYTEMYRNTDKKQSD